MATTLHVHAKEPRGKAAEQLADRLIVVTDDAGREMFRGVLGFFDTDDKLFLKHGWEEDFSTQVVIDEDNYTVSATRI